MSQRAILLANRLNLQTAFKSEEPIKQIKNAEDLFRELLERSSCSNLLICDDEEKGHSCFIKNTYGIGSDKVFSVRNRNHKEVCLIHIDGVLFPKKKSKCDCVLFSENEFFFVEFKSNAANKTEVARETEYEKCYNQLLSTVDEFDRRYSKIGDDYRNRFKKVCAFAVFNPTVPRTNASQTNLRRKFSKKVHMDLQFTNKSKIG